MKTSGHFVVIDQKSIIESKERKINQENTKIFSYIVMPQYGMSL